MYNIPRYTPSGSTRATTFGLFIVGLALILPLAWVYQALTRWIPIIQLNLFTVMGFGAGIGVLAMLMIQRGHCRSRMFAYLLTLALGVGGVAASWYWAYQGFVTDVVQDSGHTAAEVREALPFSRFIELRAENGWSISNHGSSGSSMNGVIVYLVWAVEALTVLGFAIFVAKAAAERAYCERCESWCNERGLRVFHVARADIEPLLSSGDVHAIVNVMPPAEPKDRALALVLNAELCDRCETGYVSLFESRTTIVKGKPNEKKKVIVKQLVLSRVAREAFTKRLEGVQAAT